MFRSAILSHNWHLSLSIWPRHGGDTGHGHIGWSRDLIRGGGIGSVGDRRHAVKLLQPLSAAHPGAEPVHI